VVINRINCLSVRQIIVLSAMLLSCFFIITQNNEFSAHRFTDNPASGLDQTAKTGKPLPANTLIQFTTSDHILGFARTAIYAAGADHALKVRFIGTYGAQPISDTENVSGNGKTMPPERVSYNKLWPGVTVTYETTTAGLSKSTYYLDHGEDAGKIKLHYNVPVNTDVTGALVMNFETGQLVESKPVAWQAINGHNVPVEAAYKVDGSAVGFSLGFYNTHYPVVIDPTLSWNTFLGGSNTEHIRGMVIDDVGNIFVTGWSSATWGTPIYAFQGGTDTFVAKLNPSGSLVWNTFLGGVGDDRGYGLALDDTGNLYVVGNSLATWDHGIVPVSPIHPHTGGWDFFVAKLYVSGIYQWHTFAGGSGTDKAYGIIFTKENTVNNIYVTGNSDTSWNYGATAPLNNHSGGDDALVCKFNSLGAYQWHTFFGSADNDYGSALAADKSGNIYMTGWSHATWGSSPIRGHSGNNDAVVVKFDTSGTLAWNTFLGGPGDDTASSIALDLSGNPYVTGTSSGTWGSPVLPFAGSTNAFVASLNNNGLLAWNTFLGAGTSSGFGISLYRSGDIYITGLTDTSWGSPVNAHAGANDAFVAKLSTNGGAFLWNTFMGGSGNDSGYIVGLNPAGNLFIAGESTATWGTPITPFSSATDAFVAKLVIDQDRDRTDDVSDNCPLIFNPEQTDTDSDTIGDACDNDDDGDTVADANDNCPLVANSDQADSDNDGSGDACDNCPNTANTIATIRVSVSDSGNEGDFFSYDPSISADGRYVAFESDAGTLVPDDTNNSSDIFVYDTLAGSIKRISVSSTGVEGNFASYNPDISADGKYIAFDSSSSNLVPGDTNATQDIFVYEMSSGDISRVSINSSGIEGDSNSYNPSISADGRYIAFSSYATNLVPGDINAAEDVFVHDKVSGVTIRASVWYREYGGNRFGGNDDSDRASISADGRYVVFESAATDLVFGDTNQAWDIFVHDTVTAETTRISVTSAGAEGDFFSSFPSVSADGALVAFGSGSSNLVSGDTNTLDDVFVHEMSSSATQRVSVTSSGTEGNLDSYAPSISPDGRYVAFESNSSNLVAGDSNLVKDIFVYDRVSGNISRLSVDSVGTEANGNSQNASLSQNGKFIAFESTASNLVPDDTNGQGDVFVRGIFHMNRDGDTIGDICDIGSDADGDGVTDASDNCPLIANADQADADNDGVGDACETYPVSNIPGDVDGSCSSSSASSRTCINLRDAILIMKLLSKQNTPGINIGGDVNNDGRIGIEEALFVLNFISANR